MAFVTAAERRLHGDLDCLFRLKGCPGHPKDAVGRFTHGHAGVLAAMGLARRNTHTEHLDSASQAALESLFIQHEAREDDRPGLLNALEMPEQVVGVRHLRYFLRMDERAELQDIDPGIDQRLRPGDFLRRRNDLLFHLQAVSQPYFVHDHSVCHGRSPESYYFNRNRLASPTTKNCRSDGSRISGIPEAMYAEKI